MGAKVITLNVTDQNLLRVALDWAIERRALMQDLSGTTAHEDALTERIKELKTRIV